MNVDKVVQYWLTIAPDDLSAAEDLLKGGHYLQALFFGHLYVEKLLKALVVQKTGEHAPKIHDLLKLAARASLDVTNEQEDILIRVTAYNIDMRYPEDRAAARKRYSKEYTQKQMKIIRETGEWLKSLLNQEMK